MKLHTKFKDYYDTAIGFGIDEMVHYERITEKVSIRIQPRADWPVVLQAGLLGFCGRVFPFVNLNKYERIIEGNVWRHKIVDTYYAYSLNEYLEKGDEWHGSILFDYLDNSRKQKLKQFFIDWDFQSNETFLEFKTPCWVFRFQHDRNETNGIINPKLKDYQLNRIKDAATAFQEISMYLSNILIEQKQIDYVEDKYRIQQHGFDLKESFRNTKGRKK